MTKKPQNKPKKRRIIYTQNYHKAQVMLRDPWFTEKVDWLKKRFHEIGCPIPKNGFKKYKDYIKWNERFWKRYNEIEKSPEYGEGFLKITGGKNRLSMEEYNKLKKFREEFLPPIYSQHFREILKHFGISSDNRRFKDFLELHVFLGRKEYAEHPLQIKWIRNHKTNQAELFVQIYGHTKKEDLENNWHWIAQEQKYLPDFIGKNKEWKTLERDLEIYSEYKKLKSTHKINKKDLPGIHKPRGLDVKLFFNLHKKYPKLTITSIRTIVARAKKRLGEP